jgi:hypothetical protein
MKRLILALAMVMMVSPAWAGEGETMGDFLRLAHTESGELTLRPMVGNFARGMNIVNTQLEIEGRPKFYCPPSNVALVNEQYVSILESTVDSVSGGREKPTIAMGFFLLHGLMKSFPCP